MKNTLLTFASFLLFTFVAQSQTGTIKGTVTDSKNGEELPFVSVRLGVNGTAGASTDFDGKFSISNVKPGTYTLICTFIGYTSDSVNIVVSTDKISFAKINLKPSDVPLEEFEVVEYTVPLISKDAGTSGGTVTRVACQDIATSLSVAPGVVRKGKRSKVRKSKPYKPRKVKEKKVKQHKPDGAGFGSEEYEKIDENTFLSVLDRPMSTFSIDVDAASYSNVRSMIDKGRTPPKDAVRIEEMINYFNYEYKAPEPKAKDPFSITTEVSDCPWNSKNQLVHVGIKGKGVDLDKMPPNNLVFLIDVSGSMQSWKKLTLVKKSLHMLVKEMRPMDHISIVVYAGAAGLVLPPTNGKQKSNIIKAINKLQAGGSTAGGRGIKLAYKVALDNFMQQGNNRVILCTDGDFNVGISGDEALVKLIEQKRKSDVFLTILGFGHGNLKDSKMEKLSNAGNGNYAYIDHLAEARKVLVREMGGTLLTIAKDVKLQIEFNPTKVKSYRLIGYENRLLDDEDFANDKKDAGDLGAGHTVTALYEVAPVTEADSIVSNGITAVAPKKWSKHKVGMDDLMLVKFRYKDPYGFKSRLILHPLKFEPKPLDAVSNAFYFSAAVAEFGMLLRESKFKAESSYAQVLDLAKKGKGADRFGYRKEFIDMVESRQMLVKHK
jgi:Ca-activated chloride channel family protein